MQKMPTFKHYFHYQSNVLKVLRFAVFSNINYNSIEYKHIVYKSRVFMTTFQKIFRTSTSFKDKDGQRIKLQCLKYLKSW